jgi:FKBP-type peptidyl-prolyl cis-trans isomerase 2
MKVRGLPQEPTRRAAAGDTVTVRYIGTLDDGRIFDRTDEGEPLVFTLGVGEVFPALEAAVVGMAPGEAKNVHLPAAQAYGPRREENLLTLGRELFPAGRQLRVGEKLSIEFGVGEARVMRVLRVDEAEVFLDGNHPLAGCDLTFALRLDAIE